MWSCVNFITKKLYVYACVYICLIKKGIGLPDFISKILVKIKNS